VSTASNPASYRLAKLEPRWSGDDFWARVASGWNLECCACGAVLGRLFLPFSGGFFLAGSSSHLDSRVVERTGRETRTGHRYRRFGPPWRVFAKGKPPRSAVETRPEVLVHGPFWVYCYACNTGQAVEYAHLAGSPTSGYDSP